MDKWLSLKKALALGMYKISYHDFDVSSPDRKSNDRCPCQTRSPARREIHTGRGLVR